MSSEALHFAREELSRKTLDVHHAITSLTDKMGTTGGYRQRADGL